RAPSNAIYNADFKFEFGKAYTLKQSANAAATIVSSGRGVYEALDAAKKLEEQGVAINVIDMPTIDEAAIVELYRTGKPVFIAEQNNGYLWSHFRKVLFEREASINTKNLVAINTTTQGGLHYIHSGTYAELAAHYGLDAAHLNATILKTLKKL
ncbi:MAG: transketolase C-terminal domain-containing protein, partial [Mucilaginibacter sp.]